MLNVNDAIQVHLLVETALGDAKEYEILAPEEVDDLKKQVKILSQRVAQTRQNLAIQSRYRDAAISMTKLYSPNGKEKRKSLLGHRRDNSDSADQERIMSEKKCEELATELWSLEKRLLEPQKRLLMHTAGILQMTHKGPKKSHAGKSQPHQASQNGMTRASESQYSYSNRNSASDAFAFDNFGDERSMYRELGQGDAWNQVKDVEGTSKDHAKLIASTEDKLADLNKRLRKFIIKSNPTDEEHYVRPPSSKRQSKREDPSQSLRAHLEYLENGILKIEAEAGAHNRSPESAMEETLQDLNREVRAVLLPYDPDRHEPPELSGRGLEGQLLYYQDTVNAIEMELARAANVSSRNVGTQENIDEMETMLMALWDMIQSRQQERIDGKQQRLQRELASGVKEEDDDDDDDDDTDDPNEPFSMSSFANKFRAIYGAAERLKEQKRVLHRQIKQQRELNSQSDASKDRELQQLQQQSQELQQKVTKVQQELEEARDAAEEAGSRQDTELAAIEQQALQDEVAQKARLLAVTERELQNLKDASQETHERLVEADARISTMTIELASAQEAAKRADLNAKGVKNAHNRLASADARISILSAELAQARDAVQKLEASEHQVALLRKENALVEEYKRQAESAESRVAANDAQIVELTADLGEAASASQLLISEKEKATRERDKAMRALSVMEDERDQAIKAREDESEGLHMEIARLTTEVTLARAELEGAYGSRAERAREGRLDASVQREVADMTTRNQELTAMVATLQNEKLDSSRGQMGEVQELRRELRETIEEYELMTKASVEWEREREEVDRLVDRLKDEREQLEERLHEEKMRWLGVKSPTMESTLAGGSPRGHNGDIGDGLASPSNVAQLTSTLVLKNEFKKMMRDLRADGMRALKVSGSPFAFHVLVC